MFFIRTGTTVTDLLSILPGVMSLSILFGTTSMLSVTITFEKKSKTLDRILLSPIPLELIMLAKALGAILFGIANAFIPLFVAVFCGSLSAPSIHCDDCHNPHLHRFQVYGAVHRNFRK